MSKTIVATNYTEMIAAQHTMSEWAAGKLESEKQSHGELGEIRRQLVDHGMSTTNIDRQLSQCRRRITFYGKVLAAIRAGYTIIPSMWSDIFAIKTGSDTPPRTWKDHIDKTDIAVRGHEHGQGRYVNPVTDYEYKVVGHRDNGFEVRRFRATAFNDVEFPVDAQRPEIIEATGRAMERKIFDALGIVHQGSDPLIVGHIKTPRSYAQDTLFMIAYFVDLDTI